MPPTTHSGAGGAANVLAKICNVASVTMLPAGKQKEKSTPNKQLSPGGCEG